MFEMTVTAPTLVFGWGNPSRGDDALGPLLIDALKAIYPNYPTWGQVEFITDFQLAVEHALDLKDRQRILFTDAHQRIDSPFKIAHIHPRRDKSFTSHSLSPQALMQVFVDIEGQAPAPCWLLSMCAESMELGATLSPTASISLARGIAAATQWLTQPLTGITHEH